MDNKIEEYNLLNSKLNDIVKDYNILLDTVNSGIKCFENNTVNGISIDNGILEKEKKNIYNCIDDISLASIIVNNNINSFKEGDNNG